MNSSIVVPRKDVTLIPNSSTKKEHPTQKAPVMKMNSNICQICKQEFPSFQNLKTHVLDLCGKRSNGETRDRRIGNESSKVHGKSKGNRPDGVDSISNDSVKNNFKKELTSCESSDLIKRDKEKSELRRIGNESSKVRWKSKRNRADGAEITLTDSVKHNFKKELTSCGMIKTNERKSELSKPKTTFYSIKQFLTCEVCHLDGQEVFYTDRSSLDEHMQIHRSEKCVTYKIHTISVGLNTVTSDETIVSREEELRLYCTVCHGDFSDNAAFESHNCENMISSDFATKIHKNRFSLPHCREMCMCPICKEYFSTHGSLNQHIEKCHLPPADNKLNSGVTSQDEKQMATRIIKTRLACLLCDRFSSSKRANLQRHFKTHRGATLYKYKFCNKIIESDEVGSKEKVLLEFEQVKFYCRDCKRDFLSKDELIMHRMKHSSFKPCPLCGHQVSQSKMVYHFKKMHYSERHCSICIKTYKSLESMINHFLSKHVSVQMFTCIKCKKHFPHFTKLQYHMKFKHSANPGQYTQICYVCGAKYRDRSALVMHLKSHDSNLPKCDHCQKHFTQMGSLTKHIYLHFGQFGRPKHKCTWCQKPFGTAIYLRYHIKQVHTKDFPFKCDKCGYRAASNSLLNRHMLVHSKTKRFQCSNCGVRFRWPCSLKTHIRSGVCTNT